MVKRKKPARQSNILADIPMMILPSPNPTGLPALKHANAQFFRFDGSEYAAPSIPIAGGTMTAEKRPRKPHKMFIQNGFRENPSMRLLALKPTIPAMKKALRPRRSVSWPKGSWRAPAERLDITLATSTTTKSLDICWNEVDKRNPYVVAALIQVIWACAMCKSRPIEAVTIIMAPVTRLFVAMASVAMKMKHIS